MKPRRHRGAGASLRLLPGFPPCRPHPPNSRPARPCAAGGLPTAETGSVDARLPPGRVQMQADVLGRPTWTPGPGAPGPNQDCGAAAPLGGRGGPLKTAPPFEPVRRSVFAADWRTSPGRRRARFVARGRPGSASGLGAAPYLSRAAAWSVRRSGAWIRGAGPPRFVGGLANRSFSGAPAVDRRRGGAHDLSHCSAARTIRSTPAYFPLPGTTDRRSAAQGKQSPRRRSRQIIAQPWAPSLLYGFPVFVTARLTGRLCHYASPTEPQGEGGRRRSDKGHNPLVFRGLAI